MYIITGATGHTGKRISENLLAATLEWFVENELKHAFGN
jgi:hypothetical protein